MNSDDSRCKIGTVNLEVLKGDFKTFKPKGTWFNSSNLSGVVSPFMALATIIVLMAINIVSTEQTD